METKGARAHSKEKKPTPALIWIAIIASFGYLQYGYNLWIIYSPSVLVHTFYLLSDGEIEGNSVDTESYLLMAALSMSVFPLGGATGSLLTGPLVDKAGRKGALFLNSFFALMACLFMACANMVRLFGLVMFARFVVGVTIGIYSSATPLYIAEISAVNSRGTISLIPQLFLVLGVLAAQILSFQELMGGSEGWPILMSLSGILALFQCILMTSFPESPRYLLIQKRNEEHARQALKDLRGYYDVEDEMEELRQEDVSEKAEKDMNALKLLSYRDLRWQVLSIIVLMVGQQLSGVNSVYYYAGKIYLSTGIAPENVRYISIASATLIVGTVFFSMKVIDSTGRKVLLLVGFGACSFLCLVLTVTIQIQDTVEWMPYVNSVLINIFFNTQVIGPGSLRPLLMAELFRQSSRSSAYVVGWFTHWVVHLFAIITYVQIKDLIGAYSFLVSSPICLATFWYVYKIIPETKNRTYLDIWKLVNEDKKVAIDVEPDE